MDTFFKCFVSFLLIISISHADDPRDAVRISSKYVEGPYLIYDCDGGYFACVNDESFEECKEKRSDAKKFGNFRYPCTPLKKFSNIKECVKVHYEKMYSSRTGLFCIRKALDEI